MRIVIVTLILLNFMLFSISGNCMASDWNRAPDCLLKAASEGLTWYLEKIPPGEAANYGFSSAQALTDTKAKPAFGAPLHLRTITPNALESYVKETTVAELLSDTGLWYVPVLDQQRTVAFLVIEQSENFPCKAVSFGYAPLAKDYDATLSRVGANRIDQAVLVVVLQAREHFIAFPNAEPDRLYSVHAEVAQREEAGELENSLSSIVKRLQSVVRANLQQEEGLQ